MPVVTSSREIFKSGSNNTTNPNKNICALAVANFLGVANKVHYLHTYTDVIRAVRKNWIAASRKSKFPKNFRVCDIKKHTDKLNASGFIVNVPGHVLLLDANGKVLVDTDPRIRDTRPVLKIHAIEGIQNHYAKELIRNIRRKHNDI